MRLRPIDRARNASALVRITITYELLNNAGNHPHDSNAASLLVPQVRPFCNAAQGGKIPRVVPRVVADKSLSVERPPPEFVC